MFMATVFFTRSEPVDEFLTESKLWFWKNAEMCQEFACGKHNGYECIYTVKIYILSARNTQVIFKQSVLVKWFSDGAGLRPISQELKKTLTDIIMNQNDFTLASE